MKVFPTATDMCRNNRHEMNAVIINYQLFMLHFCYFYPVNDCNIMKRDFNLEYDAMESIYLTCINMICSFEEHMEYFTCRMQKSRDMCMYIY